jgi:hypothetical protein
MAHSKLTRDTESRHVFKAPLAKSLLGLDTLAMEKRKKVEEESKRLKGQMQRLSFHEGGEDASRHDKKPRLTQEKKRKGLDVVTSSDWESAPLRSYEARTAGLKGGLTPRHEFSGIGASEWEAPTPVLSTRDDNSRMRDEDIVDVVGKKEWDAEQVRLDREWYDYEEFGAQDDTRNAYFMYEEEAKKRAEDVWTTICH